MKNRAERFSIALALVSIFLASFIGLMLQVALTRVFSTTIWYHYTFVAVSVALLGWGLGGLVLHFFKQTAAGKESTIIGVLLLALTFFMPLYLFTVSRFDLNPSSINSYFVFSLLPFFLAGTCLAFLYSRFTQSSSKLYFGDLAGASIACVAAEPTLYVLGAESTILFLGVVAAASCLLISVFSGRRKLVALSLVALVASSTILGINAQTSFLSISNAPTKYMFAMVRDNKNLSIVFTAWNSFSRIDVVEGFDGRILATIFIDADASTEVLRWDGTLNDLQYLNNSLDMIPYILTQNPKTLTIGPGGGKDILHALAGGSSNVTGVELNQIIVDVVKNYSEKVGFLYDNTPNVNVLVDEGRSFISRSSEKYDVITLSFVDSWAAISAGGYTLAENYLYTQEAFIDYMRHLSSDGLLVLTRWEHEIPRLVSTIVEASRAFGLNAKDVGKRLAVVLHEISPGKVRALVIFKNSPFTEPQAYALKNHIDSLSSQYSSFYIPHVCDLAEPYHALFNGTIGVDLFCKTFSYSVYAVRDDSPYYFNFDLGVPRLLSDLAVVVSLLALCLTLTPLTFALWSKHRRSSQHSIPIASIALYILFFSSLGIGYMFLEIALVQKFILFLGYPTRALGVILFSLLLSSGLGSLISGRFVRRDSDLVRNILLAGFLVVLVVFIYILSLPPLFASLLQQSSAIRITVSVFVLFPLGFVMGIPFPSALRLLGMELDENVTWMWSVNGVASVLGSVFAAVGSILYGFNCVMMLGAVAYAVASMVALKWRLKPTASSGVTQGHNSTMTPNTTP